MPPRLLPPTWTDERPDRDAEHLVYRELANQLSSGWTIIHDMAWLNQPGLGLGNWLQADFVLCHPQYGVIVLEVKGGAEIICKDHQWSVRRRDGKVRPYKRSPLIQASDFAYALYQRLRDLSHKTFPSFSVTYAVCFPEVDVQDNQFDDSLPRDLVIDRYDLTGLPQVLTRIRRYWRDQGQLSPRSGNQSWFEQRWIDLVLHTFVRDINFQALLGKSIEIEKQHIHHLSEPV